LSIINVTCQGKTEVLGEKLVRVVTLSIINVTWTDLGYEDKNYPVLELYLVQK